MRRRQADRTDAKKVMITLRVTEQERDLLNRTAMLSGMTLNNYLLSRLLGKQRTTETAQDNGKQTHGHTTAH